MGMNSRICWEHHSIQMCYKFCAAKNINDYFDSSSRTTLTITSKSCRWLFRECRSHDKYKMEEIWQNNFYLSCDIFLLIHYYCSSILLFFSSISNMIVWFFVDSLTARKRISKFQLKYQILVQCCCFFVVFIALFYCLHDVFSPFFFFIVRNLWYI